MVYTDICGLFLQFLGMVMNISSLLQTITLVMGTYTYSMRNPNHWTCLKSIKLKLKNQLNIKIKAVRSDRGSEYYDRYDGSGRCPEPFVNFLKE